MKKLNCVIVLLAFVGLLLLGCSDQSQSPVTPIDQGLLEKVIITEFEGIMVPTEIVNGGVTKYPDGKIIVRDLLEKIEFNVTYPNGTNGLPDLLSGTGDLELNGNANFNTRVGEFWGKLTLTPTTDVDGGVWEITWHGRGTLGGTGWTLPLKEVGHGNGGALTGMQISFENIITAAPEFYPWEGAANGYLKTH